jgi:hypothetical protein
MITTRWPSLACSAIAPAQRQTKSPVCALITTSDFTSAISSPPNHILARVRLPSLLRAGAAVNFDFASGIDIQNVS